MTVVVRKEDPKTKSLTTSVAEQLRPSFYTAFSLYYCVFAGYGMTAGLLGSFTIKVASPDNFGAIWGWLITFFGAMGAVGVVLSHRYKKPWAEVIATCALIGLMIGYVVAIITHANVLGDPTRLAGGWLPVLVSIFPLMRVLWIANGDDLFKRSRREAREKAR